MSNTTPEQKQAVVDRLSQLSPSQMASLSEQRKAAMASGKITQEQAKMLSSFQGKAINQRNQGITTP